MADPARTVWCGEVAAGRSIKIHGVCVPSKKGIHHTINNFANPSERRAEGVKAHKNAPRSSRGHFNPRANTTPALELLHKAEVGRVPHLLHVRHERMATSSFAFFRGAVAIMAADLASNSNTGIYVQIC